METKQLPETFSGWREWQVRVEPIDYKEPAMKIVMWRGPRSITWIATPRSTTVSISRGVACTTTKNGRHVSDNGETDETPDEWLALVKRAMHAWVDALSAMGRR